MFSVEWKKSGSIKKLKWNVKLSDFFRNKKIVTRWQRQHKKVIKNKLNIAITSFP